MIVHAKGGLRWVTPSISVIIEVFIGEWSMSRGWVRLENGIVISIIGRWTEGVGLVFRRGETAVEIVGGWWRIHRERTGVEKRWRKLRLTI